MAPAHGVYVPIRKRFSAKDSAVKLLVEERVFLIGTHKQHNMPQCNLGEETSLELLFFGFAGYDTTSAFFMIIRVKKVCMPEKHGTACNAKQFTHLDIASPIFQRFTVLLYTKSSNVDEARLELFLP